MNKMKRGEAKYTLGVNLPGKNLPKNSKFSNMENIPSLPPILSD